MRSDDDVLWYVNEFNKSEIPVNIPDQIYVHSFNFEEIFPYLKTKYKILYFAKRIHFIFNVAAFTVLKVPHN